MKNLFAKPILIGVLCGVLLLLIDLFVLYGSVSLSAVSHQEVKERVPDPLATPTPYVDDTGFLILLLFANYVMTPVLIAVSGAVSVRLGPSDGSPPSRLILVSAIPGAVAMLVFASFFWLSSLASEASSQSPSNPWFWPLAAAVYLAIGTLCSATGGLIFGVASGRLRTRDPD